MNDNEKKFENFVRQIKFDDTPDHEHRDRLEKDLLLALTKKQTRQEKPILEIWRTVIQPEINPGLRKSQLALYYFQKYNRYLSKRRLDNIITELLASGEFVSSSFPRLRLFSNISSLIDSLIFCSFPWLYKPQKAKRVIFLPSALGKIVQTTKSDKQNK